MAKNVKGPGIGIVEFQEESKVLSSLLLGHEGEQVVVSYPGFAVDVPEQAQVDYNTILRVVGDIMVETDHVKGVGSHHWVGRVNDVKT